MEIWDKMRNDERKFQQFSDDSTFSFHCQLSQHFAFEEIQRTKAGKEQLEGRAKSGKKQYSTSYNVNDETFMQIKDHVSVVNTSCAVESVFKLSNFLKISRTIKWEKQLRSSESNELYISG